MPEQTEGYSPSISKDRREKREFARQLAAEKRRVSFYRKIIALAAATAISIAAAVGWESSKEEISPVKPPTAQEKIVDLENMYPGQVVEFKKGVYKIRGNLRTDPMVKDTGFDDNKIYLKANSDEVTVINPVFASEVDGEQDDNAPWGKFTYKDEDKTVKVAYFSFSQVDIVDVESGKKVNIDSPDGRAKIIATTDLGNSAVSVDYNYQELSDEKPLLVGNLVEVE